MVREEEPKPSPQGQKQHNQVAGNDPNGNSLFSPRFKSVAAMAGWDEEAILVAALVVEDTPDRLSKHNKRSDLQFKTPPSGSRRKRRAQRRSPVSVPVVVLDLDEEQSTKQESEETKVEPKDTASEEKKTEEEKEEAGDELKNEESSQVSCSKSFLLPCMDKLREELSCAICLEICYEPSTTTCGHSFCKKCLQSAADKCGKKCPKCRQLISNGRSRIVNTVLWNTIQLLFPQEIEARKAAGAVNNVEDEHQTLSRRSHYNVRTRSSTPSLVASSSQRSTRRRGRPSQDEDAEHQITGRGSHTANVQSRSGFRPPSVLDNNGLRTRRRGRPSQDEDAALALRLERENLARLLGRDESVRRWRSTSNGDEDAVLAFRLQREEFMDAFRETNDQTRTSLSLARANLRAMASRAINIRTRRHPI